MGHISYKLPINSQKPYAVYCGAGVSFNSGIPTAYDLTKAILNNIPLSKKDKTIFLSRKYPFEAFIQTVKSIVPIDELLNIFEHGVPNNTHRFIANLVKKGEINLIITTNFDTLLEQALLQENIPFKKLFYSSQFKKIVLRNNKVNLVKLHGCIEQRKKLAIILKEVAQREKIYHRKVILKKIFFSGKHSAIIFLGYSFSDFFDIVPEIEASHQTPKEIIIISHENNAICKKTKHCNNFPVFRNYYNGKVIYGNTDTLVKSWWKFYLQKKYIKNRPVSTTWKTVVENWANKNLHIPLKTLAPPDAELC